MAPLPLRRSYTDALPPQSFYIFPPFPYSSHNYFSFNSLHYLQVKGVEGEEVVGKDEVGEGYEEIRGRRAFR